MSLPFLPRLAVDIQEYEEEEEDDDLGQEGEEEGHNSAFARASNNESITPEAAESETNAALGKRQIQGWVGISVAVRRAGASGFFALLSFVPICKHHQFSFRSFALAF